MKKIIFILFCFSLFVLYLKLGIYIPCLFHKLTNLYCPGCGTTRMILSLLKFNFYQAFRYNPLVFILLIIFYPIKILLCHVSQRFKNYTSYFFLIIVILYGILRNIELFSYLKPTIIQ